MMSWWSRARPWLAGAALLAITAVFVPRFLAVHAFTGWFAPILLRVTGLATLFMTAALAAGALVLSWARGPARRDGEAPLAFATGVLVLGLTLTAVGHLGLFNATSFWLVPLGWLLVAGKPLASLLSELGDAWRRAHPLTTVEIALLGLGVLGIVMAVVPALLPDNTNYDARWYHLGIAERYAAEGGISAATEGNHLIAGPHLASVLYTWAFLAPLPFFERVVLANLLEVGCFLGTLALVPALARTLAPASRSLRLAWVPVLLFPLLYVYDTGLMAGADHVAALWAPAAVLTWWQARERDDVRSWSLFGMQLAATALAKYTSVILVAPLVVCVLAASAFNTKTSLWGRVRGPLISGLVALAASSPHWLRNIFFYGNPVYPLAANLFPTHPWTRDSAAWRLRYARELFVPTDGTLTMRATDTLGALWNYHLDNYTWGDFTSHLPVFGFLYAASLVAVPFLKGMRRVWLVALLVHVAIALWFNLAHQMRYLTLLIPLMAASCAVVAAELWALEHRFVRVVLVAVVAAQLFLASEVPFLPTHRANGRVAPLVKALQFLGAGPSDAKLTRFNAFQEWQEIGAALPPTARPLVHFTGYTLGVGRVTYTDTPGIQYGLDYAELGSVAAVHARLRELGVTHLAWKADLEQPESVAGELLFRATAKTATDAVDRIVMHGWTVAALRDEPLPDLSPTVAYLGCGSTYPTGRYLLSDLGAPRPPSNVDPSWAAPRVTGPIVNLLADASYVVRESDCPTAPAPGREFEELGSCRADGVKRVYYRRR